jgi:hypothetical protein
MAMAGKSGRSWIRVHKSSVSRERVMRQWLDRLMELVGSLPAKGKVP